MFNADQIKPVWKLAFDAQSWPMSVAFAGSHRRLVAGNQDGGMLLWELPDTPVATKTKDASGKEVDDFETPPPKALLVGHENGIPRARVAPDGRTLVSVSLDKSVRIWDLSATPSGEGEIILDADARRQRARLMEEAARAEILNAPGMKLPTLASTHTLNGHHDWIQALGISADGRGVITGDDAGQVIVWDLAERRQMSTWQAPGVAWVVSAALSPDAKTALVSQYRRKGGDFNNYPAGLRLFDADTGELKLDILARNYPEEKNPPYQYQYKYREFVGPGLVATAFSPDGKLLALGQGGEEGKGQTHLLDAESGQPIRTIGGHQYGICDLCFTKDGKHLFTCGRDTTVRILQVEDGQEIAKLGKPRGGQFNDWISAISLSPDENWLAAADISGHVQIWQLG